MALGTSQGFNIFNALGLKGLDNAGANLTEEKIAKQKKLEENKILKALGTTTEKASVIGGTAKKQFIEEKKQQEKAEKKQSKILKNDLRKDVSNLKKYQEDVNKWQENTNAQLDTLGVKLKGLGYPDSFIQEQTKKVRARIEAGKGEALKAESALTQQRAEEARQFGSRDTGVNKFEIERANQQARKVAGEKVGLGEELLASQPAEYLGAAGKAATRMGEDFESLIKTGSGLNLGAESLKGLMGLSNDKIYNVNGEQYKKTNKGLVPLSEFEKNAINAFQKVRETTASGTVGQGADIILPEIGGEKYSEALGSGGEWTGADTTETVVNMLPYATPVGGGRGLITSAVKGIARRGGGRLAKKIGEGVAREAYEAAVVDPIIETARATGAYQKGEIDFKDIGGQAALQTAIGYPFALGAGGAFAGLGSLSKGTLKALKKRGVKLPQAEAPTRADELAPDVTPQPVQKLQPEEVVQGIKSQTYRKARADLKQLRKQRKIAGDSGDIEQVKILNRQITANNQTIKNLEKDPALEVFKTPRPKKLTKAQEQAQRAADIEKRVREKNALRPTQTSEDLRKIFGEPETPRTPQAPEKIQKTKAEIESDRILQQEQRGLRENYKEGLGTDSEIGRLGVRDGLQELGYNIRKNAKGEKYAELGNSRIKIEDMPPPSSIQGLSPEVRSKIASAKAADDLRTGKITEGLTRTADGEEIGGIADAQGAVERRAARNLEADAMDEGAYLEKQFQKKQNDVLSELESAKTADELNEAVMKWSDLEEPPADFMAKADEIYNRKLKETSGVVKEPDIQGKPQKLGKEKLKLESTTAETPSKIDRPLETPPTRNIVPEKKLGTRIVKTVDGKEIVRRTLGDMKPEEFQQLKRNPAKLNTLSEFTDKAPKNVEAKIDQLADIAKTRKVLANTADRLAKEIDVRLKQKGLKSFKYGDYEFTTKTKGAGNPLTPKAEAELSAFKESLEALEDTGARSLSTQPNIGDAHRARIGKQNTLEDLAEQYKEAIRKHGIIDDDYKMAKNAFMSKIAKELDDGGADHVWKNRKGDTAFWISRGKTEFTPEAKAKIEAKRQQLIKEGKTYKKEGKPAVAITEGKTKIGAKKLQKDLDQRIAKEARETGKVPDAETAESIIKTEMDELKGVRAGISPELVLGGAAAFKAAGKAIIDNPEAAIGGIQMLTNFGKLLPKAFDIDLGALRKGKLKFKNSGKNTVAKAIGEYADLHLGSSRSTRLQLEQSKNPAVKEFLGEYDELAGREARAKSLLRMRWTDAELEAMQKGLKKHKSYEGVQEAIARGEKIDGVETFEQREALRLFASNKVKRAELIKNAAEGLDGDDLLNMRILAQKETINSKSMASDFMSIAQTLAMRKALFNRISSIPAVATDPLLKGVLSGLNEKQIAEAMAEVLNPKSAVRQSPGFKAFNAGRSGTYLDASDNIGAFEKFDKAMSQGDLFSKSTELTNDMVLVAEAKEYNKQVFKKTGRKINILEEYDGLSDDSIDFALSWNRKSGELLGVSEGNLDNFAIQGDPHLKAFTALTGEPLRYQSLIQRRMIGIRKAIKAGNMEEAGKEFFPLLRFYSYGTLIGGKNFIEGAGPLGRIIKWGMAPTTGIIGADLREKYEDALETYNLAHALRLELGSKMSMNMLQSKSGINSIESAIEAITKGELDHFTLASLFSSGADLKKAMEYFAADNPLEGYLKLANAIFYGSGAQSSLNVVSKMLGVNPDKSIKKWIVEGGTFESFETEANWFHLGNDEQTQRIKRGVEKRKETVKYMESRGITIKKIGKGKRSYYELEGGTEKEKKELQKQIKSAAKPRYQKGLPVQRTEEEIRDDIYDIKYKAQEKKQKRKEKFAPVTSGERVISAGSEDKIVSLYKVQDKKVAAEALGKALEIADTKQQYKKIYGAAQRIGVQPKKPNPIIKSLAGGKEA